MDGWIWRFAGSGYCLSLQDSLLARLWCGVVDGELRGRKINLIVDCGNVLYEWMDGHLRVMRIDELQRDIETE